MFIPKDPPDERARALYINRCFLAEQKKALRMGLIREDVEDLVQIAILTTIQKWRSDGGASEITYCVMVFRRDVVDFLRKKARRAALFKKWLRGGK